MKQSVMRELGHIFYILTNGLRNNGLHLIISHAERVLNSLMYNINFCVFSLFLIIYYSLLIMLVNEVDQN